MKDTKAELIHEYEELQKIPEEFRFTEYVENFETYMIKMGLDPERIEDRYNSALLFKEQNKSDKFQGIMEVTLQHNLVDTADYSISNINTMFNNFLYRDEKIRRIGVKRNNEKPIYLLKIRDTDMLPEYIHIDDNIPNKEELKNIRHEWFVKIVYIHEHKIEEQTKELLNIAESKLSPKQERYNYAKEIRHKVKDVKIIRNEQMEGYDFRQIILSKYLFINCNLKNANFSYVDLTDALFLNCNLEGAIFYGAQLNGCQMLNGKLKQVVDIYKRYA